MALHAGSSLSSPVSASPSPSPSSASQSSFSTSSSTMSPPLLPPIALLSGHASSALAAPSTAILPKPVSLADHSYHFPIHTPTPTLWSPTTLSPSHSTPDGSSSMSSGELLAEKRRRNAGASARFRDRRKQRERELQEKCNALEKRVKELEAALKQQDSDSAPSKDQDMSESTIPPSPQNINLNDRVGQLERIMIHFQHERAADSCKMEQLEKENLQLKSLLSAREPSEGAST